MSELQRKLHKSGIPPLPNKPPLKQTGQKNQGAQHNKRDYSPLSWEEFFDEKVSVCVGEEDVFNVYRKGDSGLLFVVLHGGGYSGLSWACFAQEISSLLPCQIIAPDLRGHGDTKCIKEYQLDSDTQVKDVNAIMASLFPEEQPPTILMGHSMGGALATRVAAAGALRTLVGLTVIDVVEGSAMDALQSMHSVLAMRPRSFRSLPHAIEWCVRSGVVRNLRAARVSMPGQLQLAPPGLANGQEERLLEEEEAEAPAPVIVYSWRIDLSQTELYWEGWFRGLSGLFLSVSAPKLLLLAGVDRLDRDLTVGQMQGKFQMVVLPKVGHCVQEDSPLRVAEALATFCVRHRFAEPKAEFKPVYPGC